MTASRFELSSADGARRADLTAGVAAITVAQAGDQPGVHSPPARPRKVAAGPTWDRPSYTDCSGCSEPGSAVRPRHWAVGSVPSGLNGPHAGAQHGTPTAPLASRQRLPPGGSRARSAGRIADGSPPALRTGGQAVEADGVFSRQSAAVKVSIASYSHAPHITERSGCRQAHDRPQQCYSTADPGERPAAEITAPEAVGDGVQRQDTEESSAMNAFCAKTGCFTGSTGPRSHPSSQSAAGRMGATAYGAPSLAVNAWLSSGSPPSSS
jgi:hypothetical protein